MSRARALVPAGLLCLALTLAGCGGVADRSGGTAGTQAGRGGDLSAQEIEKMEKTVSDAEGTADQAERDSVEP